VKPTILILDEASSHLDLAREAQIDAELRKLKITRIVVAHRPETVENVDRIICLRGGRAFAQQKAMHREAGERGDIDANDIRTRRRQRRMARGEQPRNNSDAMSNPDEV
jgi:ABC-type bacteriocin/lantibiotic exporter with double-glycine peptidase domain